MKCRRCALPAKARSSRTFPYIELSLPLSIMLMPTYENLRARIAEDRPSVRIASGPSGPTGNPRFYKFFWQVFSLESPLEGDEFLQHAPRMCNAQLDAEIERLLGRGMSCMVYGLRRPRNDPANPWDLGSAKWRGVAFAPSWDDDIDPVVAGGHK